VTGTVRWFARLVVAALVFGAAGEVQGQESEADDTGPTELPVSYPIPLADISVPLEPGLLEPGVDPVRVLLSVAIDVEGKVVDVGVLESSGIPAVDEAAEKAARLQTFLPSMRGDEPVAVTIEYPVIFLAPEPPPPAIPPAELSGRVEIRGEKTALPGVEVALYPAVRIGEEESGTGTGTDTGTGTISDSDSDSDSAVPARPGADTGSDSDSDSEEDSDSKEEDLDPENFQLADEPLLVAITDDAGDFAIADIPPGTYVVAFSHPGYRQDRFVEILAEGAEREVIYRLRPTGIPQTVVVARRETDAPERVLTRDQLKTVPGAGRDPMAAVEALPGVVHVAPDFSAGSQVQAPVLRGAAAEDSVLYLDGLPVPIIFHTMSFYAVVGDDLVDRVFLQPAAAGARYGDLNGGVVGLDLRSPRKDRIGGFVDPGIGQASLAIEGPITDKSRFYVGIRRSYYDVFINLILPKDSPLDFATAPFFQDQQILLETDLARWLTLSLGYIGTIDGMKLLDADEEEDDPLIFDMRTDMHRIFVRADMENDRGFTNRLHPALTFWSSGFEFADWLSSTDRHTTFHLADDLHLPLTKWLSVDAGGLLEVDKLIQYRDVPWSGREDTGPLASTGEEDNLVGTERATRTFAGIYLSLPIRPVKALTLAPQVRLDYFSALDRAIPQVRGHIGISPVEELRISLAGGRYIQSPSFEELSEVTGNPELGPEGAWHLNAGVLWAPGPWLDIDVQGYVKWLDDQTVSSLESGLDFGDLAEFADLFAGSSDDPTHGLSNAGIGRIYGAEVFARFDILRKTRLSGWLGYSLSWAERKDFPDEDWRWFQHDRRHQFTVLLQLTLPKEVIFGARWQLQTGAPMTPVLDSTYYADMGMFIPEYGNLYSARGKPYHQLDLRFDKKWRKKNHVIDFYVDVQNVYVAKTSDFTIYSFDYRESASFSSFPAFNVAVRVEF